MTDAALLWLYGQAMIGCLISAVMWTRLAARRWRDPHGYRLATDVYLACAISHTVLISGLAIGTSARVYDARVNGTAIGGETAIAILVCMALIAAGAMGLVWAATINRSAAAWRLYLAASAGWATWLLTGWTA